MKGLLFACFTGIRDASRVSGRIVLLALHTAFMSLLVGLSAGMVAQSASDIEAAARLNSLDGMYFAMGSVNEQPAQNAIEALRTELVSVLSSGNAYSLLIPPMDNEPTVVYGCFSRVFGLAEPAQAKPYALSGVSSAHPVGSTVNLGDNSASVVGALPDSGYINLWMEYTSWNSTALLFVDPAVSLARADVAQLVEVASRIVLIHPTAAEVTDYTSVVRPVVSIVPRWVNDKIGIDFAPELQGRIAFLAVFVSGLLTTIVGVFSGIGALVRSRSRDFAVHNFVGAGRPELVARLAAFVMVAWGLPAILCGTIGGLLVAGGRYLPIITTLLVGFVLVVVAAVALLGARGVTRADSQAAIRGVIW